MPADYDLDKGYKLSYLALLRLTNNSAWEPNFKRGRWFQNDLNIFYLLQLIVKNIKIHFQYSMQR